MSPVGSLLAFRHVMIASAFSETPRAVTNFVRAHLGEGRTADADGLPALPADMQVVTEPTALPHVLPFPYFPAIAAAEAFLP